MSLNFSLDLDYEMADKITVENLKDSYIRICEDVSSLEDQYDELKPFELQDLKDFKKNRKAIKKTLKYFMTYEETEEFFGEQ
jgi:hypothetical protein